MISRLGSVQYDPLNVVGRNPDLVFGARVPGYCVDDWQQSAYRERLMYDAWDKQACLVPISQWGMRAPIRSHYLAWHDRTILDEHPEAVAATLAEIDTRGPLSSLEFEDRSRVSGDNPWLGPTRVKRILRALWLRGLLVTHHRGAGRHYYDRPERVIPRSYLDALAPSLDEYHRWIVLQRHRAVGLLRRGADASIWSATGDARTRLGAIDDLVSARELVPLRIENGTSLYHLPANALQLLNMRAPEPTAVFMAPLDNMLWDRNSIEHIYGFRYVWEVYKKTADREWGYYVLPVLCGDRFVARFDSRMEGRTWTITGWWWEQNVVPDGETLALISGAAGRFARYLRARSLRFAPSLDKNLKLALRGSVSAS